MERYLGAPLHQMPVFNQGKNMLTEGLVQSLIKKRIINNSTQITAKFNKIDYSSRGIELTDIFTVDRVVNENNQHFFHLIRKLQDNFKFVIHRV